MSKVIEWNFSFLSFKLPQILMNQNTREMSLICKMEIPIKYVMKPYLKISNPSKAVLSKLKNKCAWSEKEGVVSFHLDTFCQMAATYLLAHCCCMYFFV